MLEFNGVTKIFGDVAAVSDLSARIEPGSVTAFLGPNGAGKTTTLRILLGQLKPTSGQATIGGVPFAKIASPARVVGAVGENGASFKPRRTAVKHLTSVARHNGIATSRVREVLDLVGLADVADMRIGGYSLGMRQRLSVAQALLGDPGVLVFDEPANGLDPEGIRWMRLLMRSLADEGRTVLMSSHLLPEVEQIADKILIMSNGNLVFDGGIEVLADVQGPVVAVDSPDREALTRLLRENGLEFEVLRSGVNVHGSSAEAIGTLAAASGVALSTLHQRGPSLEDVFLDLVSGRRTQQTAAIDVSADVTPVPAERAPEPTGDPDAEVDLSAAAGTGAVAGLAGAAVVAAAADATDDIEPLPGADAASVVNYPAAADAEDEDGEAEDEADGEAEDEADGEAEDGPDGEERAADEEQATEAEAELPAGTRRIADRAEAEAAEPAAEPAAEENPTEETPTEETPTEETPAEETPAEAPAEPIAEQPAAERASDDDLGASPWAVGPSFADRLGGAAEAPAGDEPFEAEAVPSHLLETQAMDLIDAEPAAEAARDDAAEPEGEHARPEGEDARPEGDARDEAISTAPEGEEPEPTTQEIAFTSFVESFEGEPDHTGEVEVIEGEIVEEQDAPHDAPAEEGAAPSGDDERRDY
ncbi:hypothetical protein A7J15_04785 [Microbacterium sediminis]|uniref:ABC transporter domain-containing protein n=1 Tax=Microbacterium sediminis TaxID=904291 RepID=A0A1B9NE02_9MICO|nr:hypothetical protein A7J15_04785 [Microbacterium sediminis]